MNLNAMSVTIIVIASAVPPIEHRPSGIERRAERPTRDTIGESSVKCDDVGRRRERCQFIDQWLR